MDRCYNNRHDARRTPYAGRQTMGYQMPVRNDSRGCGCTATVSENIDMFPIAMAYVPWQQWHDTYELCRGLQAGTIFPELDKPFLCSRCVK